jgi:hypothetical protein
MFIDLNHESHGSPIVSAWKSDLSQSLILGRLKPAVFRTKEYRQRYNLSDI